MPLRELRVTVILVFSSVVASENRWASGLHFFSMFLVSTSCGVLQNSCNTVVTEKGALTVNCLPLLYASFVEDGQAIVKTGMKRILSARPNRNQQQKELTVTVNNNSKFFM